MGKNSVRMSKRHKSHQLDQQVESCKHNNKKRLWNHQQSDYRCISYSNMSIISPNLQGYVTTVKWPWLLVIIGYFNGILPKPYMGISFCTYNWYNLGHICMAFDWSNRPTSPCASGCSHSVRSPTPPPPRDLDLRHPADRHPPRLDKRWGGLQFH